MTRIEPSADERPVGRQELKQVIRRELFIEIFRRKALTCVMYLVIMLLVFGLPTFFIASTLAKSGFVQVPLLSQWLYAPATPLRAVHPIQGASNDALLRSIGSRARYEPLTDLVTVSISEAELTTLAAQSARDASKGSLPFPIQDLQIAVDPRVVEVFLISPHGTRETTVRVRFEPRVAGGALQLDLKEVRIGAAEVPHWLAGFASSSVSRIVTDALQGQIAQIGTLAGVETDVGTLRAIVVPAKR